MADWTAKFEAILDEMEKVGKEYALAKSQSWHLQELCPVIKSSLSEKAVNDNPKISQQRAEAIARSSKEYETHLSGTAEAVRKELELKARNERVFAEYESYRSLLSLDKKTGGYASV